MNDNRLYNTNPCQPARAYPSAAGTTPSRPPAWRSAKENRNGGVPAIAPDGFSGSGDAARSERAIRWLHPGRAKDKCRSSTPLGRALVAIGADQARGLRLQQRGYVRLMMDDVSLDRASNELCDWEGAPARRAHDLLSSDSSFASRHHGRREPERRPRRIRGARSAVHARRHHASRLLDRRRVAGARAPRTPWALARRLSFRPAECKSR